MTPELKLCSKGTSRVYFEGFNDQTDISSDG